MINDITLYPTHSGKWRIAQGGRVKAHPDDIEKVTKLFTRLAQETFPCKRVILTLGHTRLIEVVTFFFDESNRFVARSIFRQAFGKEGRVVYGKIDGWRDPVQLFTVEGR